jgi:hypothetical protein
MKYAVDRIEEEIAILESIEDGIKKEVLLSELPKDTKEGTMLIFEDNVYIKDVHLELKRRTSIRNKFDKLRKRKVDNS